MYIPRVETLLADARSDTTRGAPAAAAAAIEQLRRRADDYERDLIRMLRWDETGNVLRTWNEIAELLGAQLVSKRAAHRHWQKLISSDSGGDDRDRPNSAEKLGARH